MAWRAWPAAARAPAWPHSSWTRRSGSTAGPAGPLQQGQGLAVAVGRLLVVVVGGGLLARPLGVANRPVGEGLAGQREVVGQLAEAAGAAGELLERLADPPVGRGPARWPAAAGRGDLARSGGGRRSGRAAPGRSSSSRAATATSRRGQQVVEAEAGDPPEQGQLGLLADHGHEPEHVLDRPTEAGQALAHDPADALGHDVDGRPGGGLGDVAAVQAAGLGQVSQQLADQERVAAGALAEDVGQGLAPLAERPGGGRLGHRRDLVGAEAVQGQQLGPGGADQVAQGGGQGGPGGALVVPVGQDGQQPGRPAGPGQAAQQQQAALVGAVEVVDQQQQRTG